MSPPSPPAAPPLGESPARTLVRGLYGMVDTTAAPDRTHLDIARALLAGGCTVLQLRSKGADDAALAELARAIAPLAAEAGALFVVNDRLEVARAIPGAGLHAGDEDGHPRWLRAMLPPDRILGVSTHDAGAVGDAALWGADYVGFGPVFSGATKGSPLAPRGLAGLREAVAASDLPVVAIGGITLGNLPGVVAAGAHAAASITDVAGAPDVSARARAWRDAYLRAGRPHPL